METEPTIIHSPLCPWQKRPIDMTLFDEHERKLVVDEVRSWIGTPYHHEGTVKGSGVDCGQLVIQTFVNTRLEAPVRTSHYPHDWHMHRGEEKYLEWVEQYMGLVIDHGFQSKAHYQQFADPPEPGDLLVWKYGRTYSHGAIVTEWPYFVHAYFPAKAVVEESLIGHPLMQHSMRHYSYWSK